MSEIFSALEWDGEIGDTKLRIFKIQRDRNKISDNQLRISDIYFIFLHIEWRPFVEIPITKYIWESDHGDRNLDF